MAEILVKNSLNTKKAVKLNISLIQTTPKNNNGEEIYILEVGTTHSGISGQVPHMRFTNELVGLSNLDTAVEKAVAEICSNINWGTLDDDLYAPYVDTYYPSGNNISIWAALNVVIKDKLPTSGIDLSGLKIFINNGTQEFDITNDILISGDPFRYTLRWAPNERVLNTYDGG